RRRGRRSARGSTSRAQTLAFDELVEPQVEAEAAPDREVEARLPAALPLDERADSLALEVAAPEPGACELRVDGCGIRPQPPRLRRLEPDLVLAVAHRRRQPVADRVTQQSLRRAVADQRRGVEPERELDEAVVEEPQPRLERERHRVPVLVAKERRQTDLVDPVALAAE